MFLSLEKNKLENFEKKFWLVVFLFFCFVVFSGHSWAASITFWPNSGNYQQGEVFAVGVYLSSSDQSANAVSGKIKFPTQNLEVSSISTNGSVVDLWVQEPSFSNSLGEVDFEGIVFNPGFQGQSGKVITISFKNRGAGQAVVKFGSGAVLANDGKGTNILSLLGTATYGSNLVEQGPQPGLITSGSVPGSPLAPVVSSPTHSDTEKWYQENVAEFFWDLPADVNGVSYSVTRLANSDPGNTSDGLKNSMTYHDWGEGRWYFHLKFRNKNGWGGITHKAFMIDSTPPERVNFYQEEITDSSDPVAAFKLEAIDSLSGIRNYQVQVDGGPAEDFEYLADSENIYKTSVLGPGEHIVSVRVYDKAGNININTHAFNIQPVDIPISLDYPDKLYTDEFLLLTGKTKPNTEVRSIVKKGETEIFFQTGLSDNHGHFALLFENKLPTGAYSASVEAFDERGARTLPTKPYPVMVEERPFLQIGTKALGAVALVVSLLALLALSIFLTGFIFARLKLLKVKLRREIKRTDSNTNKAIKTMRYDLRHHLDLIKKAKNNRKLNKKEIEILDNLRKDIDNISYNLEKYVQKEVKGIPRDIKKSKRPGVFQVLKKIIRKK